MGPVSVAVVAGICMALLTPLAEANVTMTYRMYSFNSNGRDYNGECCDPFSCSCEPRFTFCFDDAASTNNMNQCAFGFFRTGEHDGNSFHFNQHDLHGIPNPIILHVPVWPSSGVKMKVKVQDDDSSHSAHDDMDFYYETWNGPIHPWSSLTPPPEVFHYTGVRQRTEQTTLVVYITGQCDRYYYGATCGVYCPQEDYSEDTGTCDSGPAISSPQESPHLHSEQNSVTVISESGGISGLIIGLICAIFIAILVVIIALALVYRHKRNKKLRDQGVQPEATFDNPMYSNQITANTQTHAPSAGNMATQAGSGNVASGLVMQPPAYTNNGYSYSEHSEITAKQRMMSENQANRSGAQPQTAVVYDNPLPVRQGVDDEVYEAMALPPKVRR